MTRTTFVVLLKAIGAVCFCCTLYLAYKADKENADRIRWMTIYSRTE